MIDWLIGWLIGWLIEWIKRHSIANKERKKAREEGASVSREGWVRYLSTYMIDDYLSHKAVKPKFVTT